jgi:hypothetical protein
MNDIENKDLAYWENKAREDYINTPISVLRYISMLEGNNGTFWENKAREDYINTPILERFQKLRDNACNYLISVLEADQELMLLPGGYEDEDGYCDEFYELPCIIHGDKYSYYDVVIVSVTKNIKNQFSFKVVDTCENVAVMIDQSSLSGEDIIKVADYIRENTLSGDIVLYETF